MRSQQLRIARPVRDLPRSVTMYCQGLGLQVLGRFEDHDGFDGVMLGTPGAAFHFEFTHCRSRPIEPSPGLEDLSVFYLADRAEWQRACAAVQAAGFEPVASFNPYWETHGRTFRDADGYRFVLQNAAWPGAT
jgi:catechol 2,3-dioxygenase-like lactoylglutathione lyase family enzyme